MSKNEKKITLQFFEEADEEYSRNLEIKPKQILIIIRNTCLKFHFLVSECVVSGLATIFKTFMCKSASWTLNRYLWLNESL